MDKNNQKNKKGFLNNFGIGKDRDYFIENLSTLVSSGMNISDAVFSLKNEVRTKRMQEILGEMYENIESGFPLWKALDYPGVFPRHVISLVRIGEESGKLSQNLQVISGQQVKDREFNSKVRSAVMYPVFVLGLALFVGIGISWFILPKLAKVFSQLKLDLPAITKALIGLGKFLGEHGAWAVPLFLVILGMIIYFVFFFPKTKKIGQSIIFNLPGIKRLIKEVEIYRFGYLLGTLLETGLPVNESLASLSRVTASPYYVEFYEHLSKSIEEGKSFQKSFKEYPKIRKIFPYSVEQLVIVGEKSGNLSKSLLSVGRTYENKIEITTKNLSVILEPVLLVLVWLGVMAIAFAVILPIYNLIGGIQTMP